MFFIEFVCALLVLVLYYVFRYFLRQEELSEKTSILAARKDELDAASKQWKSRVEQSDALNFSVAGRMQQGNDLPATPINLPTPDKNKKTPKKVFKGREGLSGTHILVRIGNQFCKFF